MPTIGEIANMRVGVWNYTSGIDGTVDFANFAANALAGRDECRVLSVTAIAGTTEATVQIDNRPEAIIPAGQALTLSPNGVITNPVIVFTDTASYVVEFVTNNQMGSTSGNI